MKLRKCKTCGKASTATVDNDSAGHTRWYHKVECSCPVLRFAEAWAADEGTARRTAWTRWNLMNGGR